MRRCRLLVWPATRRRRRLAWRRDSPRRGPDPVPDRLPANSFDNAHFSFVHGATFGVAAQPQPSAYRFVEHEGGFYAETVIAPINPVAFQRVSGSTEAITQRHMRNAYYLPFSRRLDIEYPSGVRHVIVNCFTPIDDGKLQLCQWLFRNDREEDCPAQLLIDFDHVITREDKDILESTDPNALVDTRRRGVEFSMDSDRPGMLIRKQLMQLLAAHGEAEVWSAAAPPLSNVEDALSAPLQIPR